MTTQLTLSGTPEELADVLVFLNGKKPVEASKAEKPVEKKTGKKSAPAPEPEDEVTVESLRSLVQAKAKAGLRDEVKKILKEYGAASVTELDESDYADVKAAIEDL